MHLIHLTSELSLACLKCAQNGTIMPLQLTNHLTHSLFFDNKVLNISMQLLIIEHIVLRVKNKMTSRY